MRPILFNKNETVFDTYGLGELNVTKGTAARQCNGNYTLYAEIPVNDPMVSILQKEMKLKADAGLRTKNQTFEISRIVKDSSNIVKIYGQHISHKLEYMAIRNHTILNGTAQSALARWRDALIGDYSFDVWSDIQTSATTKLTIDKATNARLALGGVEGSILDTWGGEYEFDNMTVRLHKQLGRTAPTVLEYGRNILSAETDESIEDAYTSVLPFATYTPEKPEGDTSDNQPDPITVTIPEDYVDSKYKALYAHRRIKVIDFSSEFSTDSKKKNIPTADKLRKLATDYMERNAIGKPKINTKIEYVDLAKTLDYADRAWIEELELCDIVPVYYPQIGLTDEIAKVTTITYDFVNERNESVEFGEIGTNVRATMQSGLAGKIEEVEKSQKQLADNLPKYLLNAQGNKVWYNRPDANVEHKVGDIWFEKNGLYDRMYIWNGSMWEKRIDTEDVDKVKKEVDRQLEETKTTTDQAIAEANVRSAEALARARAGADLSREAKEIANENVKELNAFRTNVQIEREKLSDELKRYSREETTNQIIAVRERLSSDYVAKSTYVENVESTKQRFEALTRDNEAKLAEFRQGIDGRLATLSSQISESVADFQKVKETSLLYERILGKSEADAPDKLSRLVMSSEIFQTEVGKYAKDDFNLVYDPTNFSKWKKKQPEANIIEVQASTKLLRITNTGNTSNVYRGFALPITTSTFTKDEKISYRLEAWVDVLPDAPLGIELWNDNSVIASDRVTFTKTGTQIITGIMTVNKTTTKSREFPLEFWLLKNGTVAIGKVSLIRGDRPPKKFTDETSTQDIATQTQVGQLAGSWSVKNLNSSGDVLNSINVLANGTNRIDGRLTHITGHTKIDNAVIKDGMIASLTADKITGGTIDASQVNVININASNVNAGVLQGLVFRGGRIESLDGTLAMDLNNKKIRLNGDNVGIVREFKGYPTQFIRYEASIENGHKHAKTIIGSNRNGTEAWNSPSFAGIVIDNNANNSLDNIYQFGDHIHFKHSQGDDGWRFSNVSQIITPGVWNKNSEIWARAFVIPKETKGATDTPTKFINLVDSVAALWKLWAHAKGQVSMTGVMQTVIQGSLDAWSYSRPHI